MAQSVNVIPALKNLQSLNLFNYKRFSEGIHIITTMVYREKERSEGVTGSHDTINKKRKVILGIPIKIQKR